MTRSPEEAGPVQVDSLSTKIDDIREEETGLEDNRPVDSRLQLSNSSSVTNASLPPEQQANRDDSTPKDGTQVTDILNDNTDTIKLTVESQKEELKINGPGINVRNKYFQLRWILIFCSGMIVISVILFVYFYHALVNKSPTNLGPRLSPSRTLLVVTILSQVLALAIRMLFNNVFDALRWRMVSSQRGVSLKTFLGLSSATPLLGAFRLLCAGGERSHMFWCAQRFTM